MFIDSSLSLIKSLILILASSYPVLIELTSFFMALTLVSDFSFVYFKDWIYLVISTVSSSSVSLCASTSFKVDWRCVIRVSAPALNSDNDCTFPSKSEIIVWFSSTYSFKLSISFFISECSIWMAVDISVFSLTVISTSLLYSWIVSSWPVQYSLFSIASCSSS